MKFKVTIAAAAALVVAVGAQWLYRPGPREDGPLPDLAKTLAVEVPGWVAQDLPIGKTEFLTQAAEKTLQYDSYFYRGYRRGDEEFTVFVTYWRSGKHPPQMVAQHTPDRCWTMNGAVCEEARFNVPETVEGHALGPAQWRKFRNPDGSITYVMFWHRVGDRFFDYGNKTADMLNPVTFWKEQANYLLGGNTEQYFFRVTFNVPPDEIWSDRGFQQAMDGMLKFGLGQGGKS